jgi:hypothetical protein
MQAEYVESRLMKLFAPEKVVAAEWENIHNEEICPWALA